MCTVPLFRGPCAYFSVGGGGGGRKAKKLAGVAVTYKSQHIRGALYLVAGFLVMSLARPLSDARTTHYVCGALLAVVLAVVLVMIYFYRQVNYLRQTMGGGAGQVRHCVSECEGARRSCVQILPYIHAVHMLASV